MLSRDCVTVSLNSCHYQTEFYCAIHIVGQHMFGVYEVMQHIFRELEYLFKWCEIGVLSVNRVTKASICFNAFRCLMQVNITNLDNSHVNTS